MRSARATPELATWRTEARALLAAQIAPHHVMWTAPGETGLLFADPIPDDAGTDVARVPRRFVALASEAVLHREPGVHALLYRVLWRLAHGEPRLLDDAADVDIRALALRATQVRRDVHKMHAFVRFRAIGPHYIAWYRPDHHVLERAAPFFQERFSAMTWTIATPDRSVSWDGAELVWSAGIPRDTAPADHELEALWRTYYAAIFNPARANPRLLRQHMPARFWAQLPEAAAIGDLLHAAAPRVEAMLDPAAAIAARLPGPGPHGIAVLREAARRCTACELCGPATQTVFGVGPEDAPLVLVGEQPGDQEDLGGLPFIGPAGEVLDAALAAAGIDRQRVYVTNAVKHFRFLPRGTKRLHQRPTADQIRACKPWLGAELEAIRPRVVVCLGATAAQALIGSRFRITRDRGQVLATRWADHLLATHHPAAVLRTDDRARYEAELVADLVRARGLLDLRP